MPHIPDSHSLHDPELVAAFAAGDAAGPELGRAQDLVAACPECAALHHDLRAIAAALPAIPAPVRPRDFRLTAEQAAALRPGGLRGVLAWLAAPRLAFTAPLGTGLAALGIVAVLVSSAGGPFAGGAATTGGAGGGAGTTAIEAAPAAESPDSAFGAALASPGDRVKATDDSVPQMNAVPSPPPAADGGSDAIRDGGTSAIPPLMALGIVLAATGSGLAIARLLAGRLARAP